MSQAKPAKPTSPPQPQSPALAARQSHWLFGAALMCYAPLLPHLPEWLGALATLMMLWCGVLLWRHAALPARWLLTLLAIGGATGIALHFHTLFGLTPGSAFLVLLFALKLLEMHTVRDGFVLVLLGYFLSMTQFFYTQSIGTATLTLAGVIVTTAALVVLNHQRQQPWQALRLAGLMLLQATPFMLLLFVLFPRIQGPLWGLPSDAFSGLTGLSDSMSPGSISQLSQSDAIAFRARFTGEFEGKSPRQNILYWRGPVLIAFDGRTWQAKRSIAGSRLPYEIAGQTIDYAVTLEPHNKPWLFALELPETIPPDGLMSSDYQLLAKSLIRTRLRYEMRSSLAIVAGRNESMATLRGALQLPPRFNPRARALAESWRNELGNDDNAIIRRMLGYFRQQAFFYTLSPPLLGEDSIDEFLFDSKRGFCEHYAAAFVFMMRAAGIPSRVVTGYQGGELNPVDGTVIVRQSDAHAWAEVWLKEHGWQRVDPTAAVAPTRIEMNLARALPEGEPRPLLSRPQFIWLHQMRFRWDALANSWNQWVIGYNPQRQRDLLASLGLHSPDWQEMAAVMAGMSSLLLLGFTAWALHQRQRLDPALIAWNRLSKKLAKRGLARHSWEGPDDYARRISAELPAKSVALAAEVRAIATLYTRLRYAAPTTQQPHLLREMKQRIARLKS